ncbi:MAG: type IV pilus twitching motility protein PilT [Fimbriimonas ginsengisoli]|uniref:Type IV pilus twitching motility protein PilT n=1 Tax=Fimbriimonas ginsengisoli TaxID=1005039 RepID=A0A931PV56_FIMGI|nr:type IV pilus twitching motility protein PilT [Fimbriimonas ginsengisoli]
MGGSDLHFKTDTGKTYVRVLGDLQTRDEWPTFTPEEFQTALFSLLRPVQVKKFEHDLELDFAYELPGVSRFRGNVYQQRGNLQAAFRAIPYVIQSMEELELPAACYDFIQRPRGFVLVTGPAGSGKSTTLAAMIDRLNRTDAVHIMTVEDPVEFVHGDHVALINQRELETDTNSFANALKHVLRQDPDVILVGEMRDLETVHLAITAAETGHLVFATLHTIDAVQTVDRVVDVFPMHQQQQIRMQMAVNLLGVVSQTLVKRADGKGRAAAFEVLVATPAIRNMIRENKTYQMNSMIQTGSRAKMQTLDQALVTLVKSGLVTRAEAYSKAKDPYEFERLLNVEGGSGGQPPAAAPPSSAPPSAASAAEAGRPPLATPTAGAVPPAATGPAPVRGQPNRPTFRRD